MPANPGDHRCTGDGGTKAFSNRPSAEQLNAQNPRTIRSAREGKEIRD
jgi:hypothetical protein